MAKVGKSTKIKACGCETLPKRRKSSNIRKFICAAHSVCTVFSL